MAINLNTISQSPEDNCPKSIKLNNFCDIKHPYWKNWHQDMTKHNLYTCLCTKKELFDPWILLMIIFSWDLGDCSCSNQFRFILHLPSLLSYYFSLNQRLCIYCISLNYLKIIFSNSPIQMKNNQEKYVYLLIIFYKVSRIFLEYYI